MEQLDQFFGKYGEIVSLPQKQVALLCLIFVSFPLCFLFRFVPRQLTHIVSLTIGLTFQYILYRNDMMYLLILTFMNYLLLKFLKDQGSFIVIVLSFLVLFYFLIYRQYTCYGCYDVDVSTILMITTIKFQTISYCITDGNKPKEILSNYQKKHRIEQFPSLLEFFSYIYFFPQSIVGPCCEFNDFKMFMNREERYRNIPCGSKQALRHFFIGLICVFLYTQVFPKFPVQALLDTSNWSFPYIFFYFNISSTLMRSKYYLIWSFLQTQQIIIGLSHSDDNKWSTSPVAKIEGEFLIHPKEKMEYWNCGVQNWLKNYVYFRVYSEDELKKSRQKQDFANNVTFMFSALWHGFYPGYFIAFFNWSLLSILAKYCFKTSLNYPNFNYNNKVYILVRNVLALSMINYYGIIFNLLDFQQCWTFFVQTYFCMSIVLYFGILFFIITKMDKPKTKKE